MKIKVIDAGGREYKTNIESIPKNAKIVSIDVHIPAYFSNYESSSSIRIDSVVIYKDEKEGKEKQRVCPKFM